MVSAGAAAFAQAPPRIRFTPQPYFPLSVGNQWTYLQRGRVGGDPFTVQVTASRVIGVLTYYELVGYAEGPALVRHNAAGELVQYDGGGPEKLWYPFSAPDGFTYRTNVAAPCVQNAGLRQRGSEVRVPAGTFAPNLAIEYQPGPCADAGFSEEVFALGIGLVRRTSITIAGPLTAELAWARVNGAAVAGPEVSFSVALDRPLYVAGPAPPSLIARMTAVNTTGAQIVLQFRTGQRYDLAIRDAGGRLIYQWSEGRFFTLALGQIELQGSRVFLEEIRLADRTGRAFPQGRYTLEAWLATSEGKLYAATVPFEIQ